MRRPFRCHPCLAEPNFSDSVRNAWTVVRRFDQILCALVTPYWKVPRSCNLQAPFEMLFPFLFFTVQHPACVCVCSTLRSLAGSTVLKTGRSGWPRGTLRGTSCSSGCAETHILLGVLFYGINLVLFRHRFHCDYEVTIVVHFRSHLFL